MRALGIDFGERRIGLALSDPAGRWALPWKVIERESDRRALYRIADLARAEGVGLLVIGEPRELEGARDRPAGDGPSSRRVRRFGSRLAEITGLPLRWVNEALTTVEAAERLRAAGLDASEKSGRRDAVAAQILLQEALDRGIADRGVDEGGSAPGESTP